VIASGSLALPVEVNPWGLPAGDLLDVVIRAEDDLRHWRGARVLVTGGTGFLGSWLVSSLLAANQLLDLHLVVEVLSRRSSGSALAKTDKVRLHHQDVRDLTRLGDVDLVVHAAASSVTGNTTADLFDLASTICEGTAAMLVLAERSRARVLHLSSGAVYGDRLRGAVAETSPAVAQPMHPGLVYDAAKTLSETLCATAGASGRTEVVVARLFAFVGPRLPLKAHFAAGMFLQDALDDRPIRVEGDGSAVRSYLYAGDLAEWCWALVTRGVSGRAYNVGSPQPVSIAELAQRVARLVAPPLPVEILTPPGSSGPHIYLPDTTVAREELGLEPRTGLQAALEKTFIWCRGQVPGS
jgi:dTDP-glucose 4,6-dehydratase